MSTPIDQQVSDDFRLFAGSANPALAKEIAAILGVELGKITIGPFPNLETRVQIEESIRGHRYLCCATNKSTCQRKPDGTAHHD